MSKLTELEFHHYDKRHRKHYLYQCDCGNQKVIHQAAVTSGNTKSCGCAYKDAAIRKTLPNNQGTINQIYAGYRVNARRRNFNFNLSVEKFTDLIKQKCHYCGTENSNNRGGFHYNGVDRIDSKLGYSVDNCVTSCRLCNYAKSNLTQEEFLEWIMKLVKQWG